MGQGAPHEENGVRKPIWGGLRMGPACQPSGHEGRLCAAWTPPARLPAPGSERPQTPGAVAGNERTSGPPRADIQLQTQPPAHTLLLAVSAEKLDQVKSEPRSFPPRVREGPGRGEASVSWRHGPDVRLQASSAGSRATSLHGNKAENQTAGRRGRCGQATPRSGCYREAGGGL